ncbi:MAG: alpha/beta fold hydrolase [Bacteroidota bacterium]
MKIKNIIITGAGGKPVTLDIFFKEDAVKKPVVIYAHGFNGFKDWGGFDLIADEFASAGFVLIKFNFSHNGTTPEQPEDFADLEAFGNNNYSKQLADLELVTGWICDTDNPYHQTLETKNISLIGHSMGGGISILFAAADARIKKLVTWASISECKIPWGGWPQEKMKEWLLEGVQYYANTRTRQQMPLYYQLHIDYKENEERLNIEKAIKKLMIPILICHGTNDIAVPVEKAYQLKEWQPAAELFIIESNHVFDRVHPWDKEYLPEAMDMVLQKTIAFLK